MNPKESSPKQDSSFKGPYKKEVLCTLKEAYKPVAIPILASLFAGLLGRALILGNVNILGYWVDSFCKAPAQCKSLPSFFQNWTSTEFLKILLLMSTVGFFLTLLFRVFFSRLSAVAVSNIYDEVTLRTSRFPMSFFDTHPAGRIMTRFSSDYGQVFRLFGGPLAEFSSIVFDLFLMVFLIALASPMYLFFVFLNLALNYTVYKFNASKLRAARRDLSSNRSPSIAHFSETTQGASSIRSFQREQLFVERFSKLDKLYLDKKQSTLKLFTLFSFQMNSLSAVLLLSTGVGAYFFATQGWVSVGSVGVALSFISLSGNTIQMFFEWLTQVEEAMVGLERLDQYLRAPLEAGALLPESSQFETGHPKIKTQNEDSPKYSKKDLPLYSTMGSIMDSITDATQFPIRENTKALEVKNLWFRYREDLPWALQSLSFSVEPGERVGIIGKTGSGKSSLIQVLLHLYPHQKGEILFFGEKPSLTNPPTERKTLENYRKGMALITQDPTLFRGTLRNNLDYQGRYKNEELLQILKKVGLEKWLLQNKNDLSFFIEEKGKNLSLGERQLLCMARCLLQDSPLIIMDEATSSVDPQSEEIMVKATEELFQNRTQLIIAHRLSTLKKCHKVLWIHGGQLRAYGPTEEVLRAFQGGVENL